MKGKKRISSPSFHFSLFTFHLLRPYTLLIIPAGLFTFLGIASTLLLIPLSKSLPDVFSSTSITGFIELSAGVTAIYLARGIFTYLQNYLAGYISINATSELRKDLYSLLLNNTPELFYKKKTGDLITVLIDDINKIREFLFSSISELVPSFITLIFTLGYIFYLNWRLSLFVLLLIPAIGGLISLFNRKIKERAENIQKRVSDSYSALYENFVNYLVIKVFGLEKIKNKEFATIEEHNNRENLASIKLISLQPSIIGVVQVAGICIIACYGGLEMINKRLTLAELLAFGTALSLTIEPVIYLAKSLGIINRSRVSLKRTFDLKKLLTPQVKTIYQNKKMISDYTLTLAKVGFSYPDQEGLILQNLNMTIKPGTTAAFVGDNGSGKSTLIKLLLGLYEKFSGEIRLGNDDIREIDVQSLRKNIKACFHEPFLFDGTIRENLLINNVNIAAEKFQEVCRLTRVSSFVDDFPEGYEYYIGEFGNKLSSGQRQRIALARAILTSPQILILDEATSALDIETEAVIYQEIRKYLPKTTIIIINHRLGSIAFVDRIYLLKKGFIVSEGSPDKMFDLLNFA